MLPQRLARVVVMGSSEAVGSKEGVCSLSAALLLYCVPLLRALRKGWKAIRRWHDASSRTKGGPLPPCLSRYTSLTLPPLSPASQVGNVSPTAEFNYAYDAEAAKVVLGKVSLLDRQ